VGQLPKSPFLGTYPRGHFWKLRRRRTIHFVQKNLGCIRVPILAVKTEIPARLLRRDRERRVWRKKKRSRLSARSERRIVRRPATAVAIR
jgi:hypothetical protein